jgi:PBP1b-binding outer membrane lipoprotein LpoB
VKIVSTLIIVVMVLVGCATTHYTASDETRYPMTPQPEHIKVYMNTPPNVPYKEIGVVEVEGPRGSYTSELIDALKKEAAENGAEGIILQDISEQTTAVVPAKGGLSAGKKIYRATAIRFTHQ